VESVVDAPTATIIASVIAGITSIAVALITNSGRESKSSKKRGPKTKMREAASVDETLSSLDRILSGDLSRTRRIAFALTLGMGIGLSASSVAKFVVDPDVTPRGLLLLLPQLVLIGLLFGAAYLAQRRSSP
jgi:hypothetical protein